MSDSYDGYLRIRARCSCGGGLDVTSRPPATAEAIAEEWRSWHQDCRPLRPGERRPRKADR